MSPDAKVCLELAGIHKAFGEFVALESIDLAVRQGELLCFLGPSGCGKTTLLRIIAGLEHQSRGRIVQNGRDISNAAPPARDYGIVFQSYALFPNLTIAANVAYGLVNRRRNRTEIDARVAELLNLVGLPDSGPKFPAQLSGGQQQRIALARALAASPGLLLLDEPLSALDAKERERLRVEIRRLQQRLGVTTIMVTHDQEEALTMADRVVVMNHGRIDQIGSPEDVYRRPATRFAAEFVGKINVYSAAVAEAGWCTVGERRWAVTRCNGSFTRGQEVVVCVRPEDVVTDAACAGDPNCVEGTLELVEFHGAMARLVIATAGLGRRSLLVDIPANEAGRRALAPGMAISCLLPADALHVFPPQ